jgi:predicted porin
MKKYADVQREAARTGAKLLLGLILAGCPHTNAATESFVTLSCSSDGGRRHCAADTSAGVALMQSTGTASCLLGRTWGYDAQSVWVTEGCGGEFIVGNAAHESERMTPISDAQASVMPQAPPPAVLEDEAQAADMPQAPPPAVLEDEAQAADMPQAPPPAVLEDEAQAADMPPQEQPAALPDEEESRSAYYVYTRFGAATAFSGSEAEVQENGSRARFEYSREYSRGEDVRFFAVGEWGINLTRGGTVFNAGETTSGGFVVLDTVTGSVLGSRLGYVGIDFANAGTVTLGKQWGVHYDIAGYTDAFNAFGADASATFNAQSDGGIMGTGRADGALTYRRSLFEFLEVGAQVQIRSLDDGEFLDGLGLSLRARLSPRFEVGISHTRAFFDDELKRELLGLEGDGIYRIAGLKYQSNALTLAAIFAQQRNGDLARVSLPEDGGVAIVPEVFDADGIELFARYQRGSFGLLAGFLDYEIKDDNVLIDPDSVRRYYIAGFDYTGVASTRLYAEYRLSDTIDADGMPGEDIFVLGAKYEFSARGNVP